MVIGPTRLPGVYLSLSLSASLSLSLAFSARVRVFVSFVKGFLLFVYFLLALLIYFIINIYKYFFAVSYSWTQRVRQDKNNSDNKNNNNTNNIKVCTDLSEGKFTGTSTRADELWENIWTGVAKMGFKVLQGAQNCINIYSMR